MKEKRIEREREAGNQYKSVNGSYVKSSQYFKTPPYQRPPSPSPKEKTKSVKRQIGLSLSLFLSLSPQSFILYSVFSLDWVFETALNNQNTRNPYGLTKELDQTLTSPVKLSKDYVGVNGSPVKSTIKLGPYPTIRLKTQKARRDAPKLPKKQEKKWL
jgi:hypothetical protein